MQLIGMAMKPLTTLILLVMLAGCANYGAYTGSSSYDGGDENGVTVYKTIHSTQDQVDTEAILHCKKFDKVSRLLSCSSLLLNSCTYACDEPVITSVDPPKKTTAKDDGNKHPGEKANLQAMSGSGFFISNLGHVLTNAHVVKGCKRVSVGNSSSNQVSAEVISKDKQNDLALLKLFSMDKASASSKSLIKGLDIKLVPLAANGLLRSDDVKLGEKIMVAGYPYGEGLSDTIKVTSGIVSATRGLGDNSAQFQLDAAVQSGNSGGPIYDSGGNIVGVVVSQLSKLKVAQGGDTLPENVNFGIKASAVKTFLNSSGLPSKVAQRSSEKSTMELAEIAQKQALMVTCLK